ncbi:MAG: alpha/beta hydrolase, partial [Alphaproteobacteria bacterium]
MHTLYWIVGVYLVVCMTGYLFSRQFIYFPNPYRAAPQEAGLTGVEEVELTAPDGVTLVAWYAKAKPDRPTLLYFHGNAGNAASRAPKIERILASGCGLLYLNNRGY